MPDLEVRPTEPVVTPPRRRRWLPWFVGSVVVVVAVGGGVVWWLQRPPAPVSVNHVIDEFRNSRHGPAGATGGAPPTGVYVYATSGGESISIGIKHHYPARSTLTVTSADCGLNFRWDALAGRWSRWQVCRDSLGWHLTHYTDAHKFSYLQDVKDYACGGYPTVVCRAHDGVLTSTVQMVGTESMILGGVDVRVSHLRIAQTATGKSVSNGTVDAWVLPSGLPARLAIRDHGYSVVLGSHIDYYESATFRLTSTTPRR